MHSKSKAKLRDAGEAKRYARQKQCRAMREQRKETLGLAEAMQSKGDAEISDADAKQCVALISGGRALAMKREA